MWCSTDAVHRSTLLLELQCGTDVHMPRHCAQMQFDIAHGFHNLGHAVPLTFTRTRFPHMDAAHHRRSAIWMRCGTDAFRHCPRFPQSGTRTALDIYAHAVSAYGCGASQMQCSAAHGPWSCSASQMQSRAGQGCCSTQLAHSPLLQFLWQSPLQNMEHLDIHHIRVPWLK
jgi:hypothetical protein